MYYSDVITRTLELRSANRGQSINLPYISIDWFLYDRRSSSTGTILLLTLTVLLLNQLLNYTVDYEQVLNHGFVVDSEHYIQTN